MKPGRLAAFAAAACICAAARATDNDLPAVGSADPQQLATRFLSSVYGDYDRQQGCWVATAEDQDFEYQYCMKLDRVDALDSNTGKRLYILAAGDLSDPSAGGHFSAGLIGAFVLEDHGGHSEVIAANGKIIVGGSFGAAPKRWKLVRLGPSDYWGWQNTQGYTQQGLTESFYTVLAPFGKSVRDLARQGLRAARDDSGMACPESSKSCGGTAWTSKLDVDAGSSESIYPLLITVDGTSHGKALQQRTFKLPFERKSWSYQKPDDALFREQ